MEKRKTFLQAVSKEFIEDFLLFVHLDKDSFDTFSLFELMEELPRKQKEELWERLKNLLIDVLLETPVDQWQRHETEREDCMGIESRPKMKETFKIISAITHVVFISMRVICENDSYSSLVECAVILTGILHAIPESERYLHNSIFHLGVAWWQRGLEAKEDIGKSAFLMILRRILRTNTIADICRLWEIHDALLCFDYDLDESNEVKNLLLQCFMNLSCIKIEKGRRFLSFVFIWDADFVKIIHVIIKKQLKDLKKSMMPFIGEIYFRAWKKASGTILEVIEDCCIQDYMYHGIHLPRNSPVNAKVREVLNYIHNQKHVRQGVEEMLYRLYKPILWRALKARNPEVRANAALLFIEAFPVRDPNFSNVEMDNEIQKQFEVLYNLLDDPYPLARSTGILGVCKITSKYWEMMPPLIVTDLIRKVVGDLAFDSSSADVRCSVFKCLPLVLENPLSHPLLEQLLPTLKHSLHDNSEKVRVAFIDLLLKIKAVKAAKFWKICSMEHLLTRLEIDSRPVSQRLVSLLFNSFLPVNQPEAIWCERCVTLIQMNPGAARKFYKHAHEHTAATNIAKLIHIVRHCLSACIQKEIRDSEDEEEVEKENVEVNILETTLSINDISAMSGLLEVIVILWKSICKNLEHNREAQNYTIRKFASVLPEYLKHFTDDRCKIPLFMILSFMPASAVPPFSCSVISALKNQDDDESAENQYHTLIDCLCSWGQVGHIFELICDWLPDGEPKKKRRPSKRQVRIQDLQPEKPNLALDYLEYLLLSNRNRDLLLSLPERRLNSLLKALDTSKKDIILTIQSSDEKSANFDQEAAIRAFTLYCRLCIHFHHKFTSEEKFYLSLLEKTGFWIEKQVLPIIHQQKEEQLLSSREIYQQTVQAYILVCKDAVMIGIGDSNFNMKFLKITLEIIKTDKGHFCIPLLLCILKVMIASSLIRKSTSKEEVEIFFDLIQKVFQKMLECVAYSLKNREEEGQQLLYAIQVPLAEFINAVQSFHMNTSAHQGMLSTLLAAIVVEISHKLRKLSGTEDLALPKCQSHLPPFSKCLVEIIMKSVKVLRSFLEELTVCIASEEFEGIVCLTAVVCLIVIISKGKHNDPRVKDAATAMQKVLNKYMEITMEEDSYERSLYESSVRCLDELLRLQ